MKKLTILLVLLAFSGKAQISDQKIADTIALWIVPNNAKSITAAKMNAILDHINLSKINKDSLIVTTSAGNDTIFVTNGTTTDTVLTGGFWSATSNDITNNNSGKVTINGDSLYLYPLPDLATKVGRIATLLTNGEVEWTYPLTLYGEMLDTLAESPSAYVTWVKDTTNKIIYNIDSSYVKLNNWLQTDYITSIATNTSNVMLGQLAFIKDTRLGDSANYSNFIGFEAGYDADTIQTSSMIGFGSGIYSHNIQNSTFLGQSSGSESYNVIESNFIGFTGLQSYNISNSDFFGNSAGNSSYNIDSSTFIGTRAGYGSSDINNSTFIGRYAGLQATNIDNEIWLGGKNPASDPLLRLVCNNDSIVINGDLNYGDTYWKDATVSAYSLAGGVQAPTLQVITGAISGLGFSYQTANDIAYGQAQLNHDYKLGTDIEAHVHWTIDQAPAGGNDTIAIAFEYSWADIGEAFPTSTVDTTLIVVNSSTQGYHYLTELDDAISAAGGDGLSSVIIFRIERLQNYSKDTYPSWWILLDVDFHHQVDSPGSDDELIK